MELIFNDATTLQVQSAVEQEGHLLIKTISATLDELRAKFSDAFACKRIQVRERGQIIAEYNDYTVLYRLEEYPGGIFGVVMYQADKTPEAEAEVQAAVVLVAQIQAQTFTEEQALTVQAIYPVWNGKSVEYKAGTYLNYQEVLYKVLQNHTSQESWAPDVSPSLFTKVLVDPSGEILPWEQPDSTNPYMKGDKVTHKGKTWESLVDRNVWEPGVVGTEAQWKEVTE